MSITLTVCPPPIYKAELAHLIYSCSSGSVTCPFSFSKWLETNDLLKFPEDWCRNLESRRQGSSGEGKTRAHNILLRPFEWHFFDTIHLLFRDFGMSLEACQRKPAGQKAHYPTAEIIWMKISYWSRNGTHRTEKTQPGIVRGHVKHWISRMTLQ